MMSSSEYSSGSTQDIVVVRRAHYDNGMIEALFINDTNHYLHPSSFDMVELADRDDMAAYLLAPCPADTYLESFATTGHFGCLDFWFASRPGPVPRDVNRPATELLVAAARFRPRTVPLLRGRVMLVSHDGDGALAGLSDDQIRAVLLHANRRGGPLILDWRYAADARAQRRRRKSAQAAHEHEFWEGFHRRARNRNT